MNMMKKIILTLLLFIQSRYVISQISQDFYEGKFLNIYANYQPYVNSIGAQIFEFEGSGPESWDKWYGFRLRALPDFLSNNSILIKNRSSLTNNKGFATSWAEWFLGATIIGKDRYNVALAANILNIWALTASNVNSEGFATTGLRGKLDFKINDFLLLSYTQSHEFSIASADTKDSKGYIFSNSINLYTSKLVFFGVEYLTFRYRYGASVSYGNGSRLDIKLGIRII
jgi:hypothetical protein